MGYTPTNWQNGDVLSVEKLNKIENGIVNATEPLNMDNQVQISYGVDGGQIEAYTESISFADAAELYNGSKILVAYDSASDSVVFMSNVGYSGNYMFFKGFHADLSAGIAREFGVVLVAGDESDPVVIGNIGWADEPFVVDLTPTEQDFSGTMSKTVAEIYAAYQLGRKIVFRVWIGEGEYIEAEVTKVYKSPELTYPSFNVFVIVDSNNLLIEAGNGATNDGEYDRYGTVIYPLTPMGT